MAPGLIDSVAAAARSAETEARLWASLRGIADAGATVLLISHRRSARAIADEVVTLRRDGDASTSSATQEAQGAATQEGQDARRRMGP